MTNQSRAKPYMNPYLAGTLLGIVLFLAFFITGNVFHLAREQHVIVNPRAAHQGIFLPADLHQHADAMRGVFFIGQIVIADDILVPDELLGPMALFACFPGGSQIVDGRGDWPGEGVPENSENLADAGDL